MQRFERTIAKLDDEDDSETIIEDCMLAAAHAVNAAMHKLATVREDKDIRHNMLSGFIKKEKSLNDDSGQIAELLLQLEELRPSFVYGKGEDKDAAILARGTYNKIREVCLKYLQ